MTQPHRQQRRRAASSVLLGRSALVTLALGLATGCADDDDPTSQLRTPTLATFSPSAGSVPLPNDLLFSGSTDGTLQVPVENPAVTSDPAIALGTLDGWSTTAPITIQFTRPLDTATVIGGSTVRLFEVTATTDNTTAVGGGVVSVDNELTEGVDYEIQFPAAYGDQAIVIQPLAPLAPSQLMNNSVYQVVVTNGVLDADGVAVERDAEYIFASVETLGPTAPASLVQLHALINSQLDAYTAATSDPRADVVVSFTFTTQSIGSALTTVFGIANGQESTIISTLCAQLGTCGGDTANSTFSTPLINQVADPTSYLGTASELLGGAQGGAQIYAGIFKAPYYLTQADNMSFGGLSTDTAAISTPWFSRYATVAGQAERNLTRLNPLPSATSAQQMPMLISIPDASAPGVPPMPGGGWPIAIFQHGITSNRTAMLGIAEEMALAGMAVVAIDLPLHGLAAGEFLLPDGMTDIFVGYNNQAPISDDVWERTFGMDLLTEGGAPSFVPDGTPDSSGAHFINLTNLAVSRDNIRQAVSDLLNLRASLGDLTILGADVTDESEVHFIGHSLGGIVGTPFLGIQPGITAASLGMPGGGIPYLLGGSFAFGPVIDAGLVAAGVEAGTPEYEQFFWAAQTVVDTADPINWAAAVTTNGTPIYLSEIVGGGVNASPPDLVIPNAVAGAPLAGTEPLITALGLSSISTTTTNGGGVRGAVRFIEGNHGTLLTPQTPGVTPTAEELAAYLEMQAQVGAFHLNDGTEITVTDTTVVQ